MKDIIFEHVADGFNDRQPLYQQLADGLRNLIVNGGMDSGHAIPSERILREKTGASRVTVRKAIDLLIDEGLLFRVQGSGTYVSERIEHKGEDLTGFTDEMRTLGAAPSSKWLVKVHAQATAEEADMLQVKENDLVCKLSRVRLSNDTPMGIEHAVIPAKYLPNLDLLEDSLYHALNKNKCAPVSGDQKVTASIASSIEAGLLSIKEGAPVLRIERFTFLDDQTPLEYTRSVYRGDKYIFTSKLQTFSSGW